MKKVFLLILFSVTSTILIFSQNNIERKIKNKLDSYKFFNDYEAENNKQHYLYRFELNYKNKITIAFTTSKRHDAHSCGGFMSVFSLLKTDNLWEIDENYIKVEEIGS
ncbi:MAG: hypothetical protein DRI94_09430 [Bacteroidetes bacterium]|nr:MAG: hypothetical protein DRI94_09430 [Bacteroidota bacterium]